MILIPITGRRNTQARFCAHEFRYTAGMGVHDGQAASHGFHHQAGTGIIVCWVEEDIRFLHQGRSFQLSIGATPVDGGFHIGMNGELLDFLFAGHFV